MAEKKSGGTTFETIMHDLKAGQYAPVYVLMGEESYYIDRITRTTILRLLVILIIG